MTFIMESEVLFAHYKELQAYVAWADDDVRRVSAALPFVQPSFAALIDDFYEEIDRHAATRTVLTGGEEQVKRLKGTLVTWLEELFSGVYDADYVTRRWKVGWRHVEIGLSQVYTNVALSRLRDGLFQALQDGWNGDREELSMTIRSLNKLLDLDLAIIEDAYQAEYMKRLQQSERLATIGQMSGGVAHELRNPLNVIKTSIYYLLHTKNPNPEKTVEHLKRIHGQVDAADAVTTTLTDFARLPLPQMGPFALQPCLHETLELTNLPDHIEVELACPADLPPVLGDRRQIAIVFSNLIRNARDAMPDGGKLTIAASRVGSAIEISVSDTGEGIGEEDLKRILEPLYSTKARGLGLGLAITSAILDKHGASLSIDSRLGKSSIFTVRIAIAEPTSGL